jgi:hypothetical protein
VCQDGDFSRLLIRLGLVSLMAIGSKLWHVKGGNDRVPRQMLERLMKQSNVQFVRGHVKSIDEIHRVDIDDQGGRIRLAYQPGNSQLVHAVDYDYAIVAFPLHRDNMQDFHLDSNDGFLQSKFRMQSTHANFLHGQLDCSSYNLTNEQCDRLHAIYYTNPNVPYRSVARQRTVNQTDRSFSTNAQPVYKIFSPRVLSLNDYEKIFDKQHYQHVHDIAWLAYPQYEHPQAMPPIQLKSNVFYVNAMEWSASCMEIETISARNIAMLLTNRLGQSLKRTDQHVEF